MRWLWLWLSVTLGLAPCATLAHAWYEGLVDPYGRKCCEQRDCQPVELCRTRSDALGVVIERRCVEVPRNRVLSFPAPDGQSHAFWYHSLGEATPLIRCVILPAEA